MSLYERIQTLGHPAVTVVHDMIAECRAQDESRQNGYSWDDRTDSLRIKLNVWILSKLGEPLLPVGAERPPEPANPKTPPTIAEMRAKGWLP